MGKIAIIIRREYNERVRKRSFIIMTILTPILMLGLIAAPTLMTSIRGSQKEILVVDRSGFVAPELRDSEGIAFRADDRTYEEARDSKPDVFGILVVGEEILTDPRDVQLYCFQSATLEVETAVNRQLSDIVEKHKLNSYNIEDIDRILAEVKSDVALQSFTVESDGGEKASSSALTTLLAYIFGFLIYMFVILYGVMVMQGVIEEKSSKVLEIMISSVRPFELMMGKIIGVALVALTQVAIWAAFLAIAGNTVISLVGGASVLVDGAQMGRMAGNIFGSLPDAGYVLMLLGWFVVFFIGGYLLYASMFAAIGSAVDAPADAQQMQMPVTLPIILSIIVALGVMREPNGAMAVWFSMIPLTSPVVMMARIPFGIPWWQVTLSTCVLYASFLFMVWFAGKIYRVGILMHGKKPSLRELIKWTKY
ncbi:MAG: ABC transporter permease [Rikenellaceae bacterium]|jgi:ABC-2 type transport system permease protein|nr:ABC transporter permease [Rikenellaceae bacterium]